MEAKEEAEVDYDCEDLKRMGVLSDQEHAECCPLCHKWGDEQHEGDEGKPVEECLTYIKTPAGLLIGLCHQVADYTPLSESDDSANAWLDEEVKRYLDTICPGCGYVTEPDGWQILPTKVNLEDGTQKDILFCDKICADFWDDTGPEEWTCLHDGTEVQLAYWTCTICSGVFDCNMVKVLVDTEWNDDEHFVCSFCEEKGRGRYKEKVAG